LVCSKKVLLFFLIRGNLPASNSAGIYSLSSPLALLPYLCLR
jgi:hypothetical protein